MSSLAEVLKNSLVVLKKEPKLFLPKIFLALLWGSFLLFYARLFVEIEKINSVNSAELQASMLKEVFSQLILLLFVFVVFFVVDSVVNSAYPFMIQKYLKKEKFSVLSSIKFVLLNFWKIIFPIIISSVIFILVLLPFVSVFAFFFVKGNLFLSLVSGLVVLIVGFIGTVLFYFIYPVSSIERKGLGSVIETARKSRKNFKEAFFGSFILMLLSLFSAFLVSFSETEFLSSLALIFFVLLRIITAVLATYSMVLNPLLYFKE